MQHDYFASLTQSDHCFLVSSLPLPSSLRELPTDEERSLLYVINQGLKEKELTDAQSIVVF